MTPTLLVVLLLRHPVGASQSMTGHTKTERRKEREKLLL